ncbi:hypothetical protein [Kribbella deserti]|uniref:Glycoside hydrolase family 2 immunoglobulin-like beta-sandwich domain-containing protein n=1 Tax=Kribbella deserti TaxID=1926257 RepID=A0ABV6QE45_9ACTN
MKRSTRPWRSRVTALAAAGALAATALATASIERLQLTPDVPGQALRLTADTDGPAGVDVEATAYDGTKAIGKVRGKANTQLSLPVPNPKLWSPGNPFLYTLKVRVIDNGKAVDQVGSYFGMRSVGKAKGADGKLRLTLNGKILSTFPRWIRGSGRTD